MKTGRDHVATEKRFSPDLLDFGMQPVSNRFLSGAETAPSFPLALKVEAGSGLIRLAQPFPAEELCPRYPWLTCFEPEDHLDKLVQEMTELPGITKESKIGAYSFKDDSTLRRLEKKGFSNTWRLDPASDLKVMDPQANVETFQKHFTADRAQAVKEKRGPCDIFIVRHVLEHSYDLEGFLEACRSVLRPGGYVVFEVPDCTRAIDLGDFTTIWEEHIYYFTPQTLRSTLEKAGFGIHQFESVEYPFENSLVAMVRADGHTASTSDSELIKKEVAKYRSFINKYPKRRDRVRGILSRAKEKIGSLAMFGAGHLSVAYLSLMGVADLIDFVVDDNPHKKGMRMPVGNLTILGSQAIYEKKIRLCLLSLNPQNQPKVVASHSKFQAEGGRFASIFPGSPLDLEEGL